MTERPNADYGTMPIGGLYECLGVAENDLAQAKYAIATIIEALGKRYTQTVMTALASAQKLHGTVKAPIEDGFTLKADFPKKVEWDQDKLKALAGTLTWAEIQHYFKIEFAVPEAIYKATPPGPIKDALDVARTTTYGDPKITIMPPEAA